MGEEFKTDIGLPQGLVLDPTFFNIFICDLLDDITGDYTTFADNGIRQIQKILMNLKSYERK